jgi:arylsulfatase A-like enzyme
MVNGPTYLGVNGTVRDYEEWKFGQFALAVIQKHNASDAEHPLFLNYNMHIAHEPLQAPHPYFRAQEVLTNATFPDAPGQPRAIYHAMVHFADDVLGNLTAALVANGDMWKNTLVVLTSDNGGGSMWACARGCGGGAQLACTRRTLVVLTRLCVSPGPMGAANNWPLKGHKMTVGGPYPQCCTRRTACVLRAGAGCAA